MKDWTKIIISPNTTLRDAISLIDNTGLQLAVVLGENYKLLGLLSDGDVRRALLSGYSLDIPTSKVMNCNPITANACSTDRELLTLMRRNVVHHIPLLNDSLEMVNLVTLDSLIGVNERPNWVVLMAGGLGRRLMPLTQDCPKPMLYVGEKPILESIIDRFVEQGFSKFFISVNYLAEIIQNYFGDGSKFGVDIKYLQEQKRLGTAGSLSILPDRPSEPFIVMNGDLLTRVRFDQLLAFHEKQNATATMAVREYDFQVPYGVVSVKDTNIISIDEKPVHNFFVNAGIYTLSPEVLDYIPNGNFFDMPSLFEKLLACGKNTSAYPVREYWLDVGRIEELNRARQEWNNL